MAMGRSLSAAVLRARADSTRQPRERRGGTTRAAFRVEGLERRLLLDGSDLALYRPAYATTFDPAQQNQQSIYLPDKAFDGDPATRWSAGTNDAGTYIQADLGATFGVTRVRSTGRRPAPSITRSRSPTTAPPGATSSR